MLSEQETKKEIQAQDDIEWTREGRAYQQNPELSMWHRKLNPEQSNAMDWM